jgi:hypothetical protein
MPSPEKPSIAPEKAATPPIAKTRMAAKTKKAP